MPDAPSHPIRFTVSEYLRMSEAGLFGHRRTELLNGKIKKMPRQSYRNMWSVSKINVMMVRGKNITDWWVIRGTLYLDDMNAPEPDFQLFDVPAGTPQSKLPLPILVIQVSDGTYARDSGRKLRVYARCGIEDYWIVNLNENVVEVYRRPQNLSGKNSGWHYASMEHLHAGESVALLKRPELRFEVAGMLA